jgi:hypothetical protein
MPWSSVSGRRGVVRMERFYTLKVCRARLPVLHIRSPTGSRASCCDDIFTYM